MYANLAPRWVADSYFAHAVTILTHEREAMDAWFSLGFGMVGVDAVRDISPIEGRMIRVEIRRAGLEDIDIVLALRVALKRHLAEAPIFIPLTTQRGREFYEKWLPDSTNALWLAYRDRDAVAFMELMPSSRLGVVMPVFDKNTVTIIGAFTKEYLRQSGIGTTLLNHSLEWARSAGYKNCAVDFESANIIGSSFWYGNGFKPVCYSLVRYIDERITQPN
jgi:GNAT superfamily N-acetyltransferase